MNEALSFTVIDGGNPDLPQDNCSIGRSSAANLDQIILDVKIS